MSEDKKSSPIFPAAEVTEDFIPKRLYFSPDFARLEEEALWPYVLYTL